MGLRKFSTFSMSSEGILVPRDITRKSASKLANELSLPSEYDILPGKLYITTRAISNRCNDNGDFFSAAELRGEFEGRTAHNDEYGYQTFIGKPVFLNHNNTAYDDPRGRMIASFYNEEPWTEKTASLPRIEATEHEPNDAWIKVFHEIDADRYPLTAMAVRSGMISKTSMGTDIEFAECSVCANKARYTFEYCDHIANHRMGKKFAMEDGSERYAYDKNYGLQFFEDSLLTVDPADPTADILEVLAEKPTIKLAASEWNRTSGESSNDYLERRSDLVKAAYRTTISFAGVNRRNDISVITRRNELATNTDNQKRKILAGAQNSSYRLFVKASHPNMVWLLDRKNSRTAYYGKMDTAPTFELLKSEMGAKDFQSFAAGVFKDLDKKRKQAEDNDAVQDHVDDIVNTDANPDDGGGDPVDNEDTVHDHAATAAGDMDGEPTDASGGPESVEDVPDALPAPFDGEADDNSDAVTNVGTDEDVVVARKKLSADDEDSEGNEDDKDDADADSEEEDKMDAEARKRAQLTRRRRTVARRRLADGLDLANPDDKGMNEDGTLDAPQDEVDTVKSDDADHGVPGGPGAGAPEANPTVEDEELQKSVGFRRAVRAEATKIAKAMNDKMWDALEMADHQARLGEIHAAQVRVTARKLYDTMSHPDIRAQKSVYAKMETTRREASGRNGDRPVMRAPVMPKVAAQRAQARSNQDMSDIALASLAIGE